MNKLIIEILPTIEQVAKRTTRLTDNQNELIQIAVLKCYDNESTVKRLYQEKKLTAWLTTIIWNDHLRLIKTEPIDRKQNDKSDEEYIDMLEIVKHELNNTERIWLKAYLKEGTYKGIAKRTGIHRNYIAQRMKSIVEKCKKLKGTL